MFLKKKGALGNCFVIAAIHSFLEYVAAHPFALPLVFEVLGFGQDLSARQFHFRFFEPHTHERKLIVVDDLIPVNSNTNEPAFAKSVSNPRREMWAPLLEKALLTAMSSDYARIDEGGDPRCAVSYLLPHEKDTREFIYFMAVTSGDDSLLTLNHAYTLIATQQERFKIIDPRLTTGREPTNDTDALNDGIWHWNMTQIPEHAVLLAYGVDATRLERSFPRHVQRSFWLPTSNFADCEGICIFLVPFAPITAPRQLCLCFEHDRCLTLLCANGQNFFKIATKELARENVSLAHLKYIYCLNHFIVVAILDR